MKKFDRASGVVCLIFAAIIMWQSAIIPMGRIHEPGPGFMPFWVGFILAVLSAVLCLGAGLGKAASEQVMFLSKEGRWLHVLWTAVVLLAYAFLIEILGFIISTLLLLIFFFRAVGRQKWWVSFSGTILVTLVAHIIFKVALKVQLPAGLFRI